MASRRWARLIPWLVAVLALTIYASTAAPDLTWAHHGADGGDLIAAAMTWGVPHPSGYPTYVLIGRLFALLPLGPLARRFNLLSATMAAIAAALASAVSRRIATRNADDAVPSWWPVVAQVAGGTMVAFAPAIWSQALIAEVYTLHLALLAGLLVMASIPYQLTDWQGLALGILAGIGLGNHLTLALTLPGVAILSWPKLTKRGRIAAVAGTLLGLSIYAYVPLAASEIPPVSWGNAATLSGFWWLVSGQLYHRYALAASWPQVAQRLLAATGLWREQFGLWGVALAFPGIYGWIEGQRWRLLAGMGSIWLLVLAYAVTYETADSMLYLLPCYLVGALWIVAGANWLARVIAMETGLRRRWIYLLVATLLVAMPITRVIGWYDSLDLSDDHEAEAWISETLDTLPKSAAFLSVEDRHTFALWYATYAQERRPDILVVDVDLYVEP
ncbi:MAG: protein O-mannosyl-transferase family [Anaerolineae bacterium]